eukprot:3435535-Heterocapsa_arctica.AAC.1
MDGRREPPTCRPGKKRSGLNSSSRLQPWAGHLGSSGETGMSSLTNCGPNPWPPGSRDSYLEAQIERTPAT